MSLAPGLLEILACPRCKGRLLITPEGSGLGCPRCLVAFPVTDDIPVMIFDEAVPWTPVAGPGNP
ncbi:MAG: Trm112 family protein [Candidatus Methylomirabilia bacterium]